MTLETEKDRGRNGEERDTDSKLEAERRKEQTHITDIPTIFVMAEIRKNI